MLLWHYFTVPVFCNAFKKVFISARNVLSPSTFLVTNVRTLLQILCDIKCDNAVEFNDLILELKAQKGENKEKSILLQGLEKH